MPSVHQIIIHITLATASISIQTFAFFSSNTRNHRPSYVIPLKNQLESKISNKQDDTTDKTVFSVALTREEGKNKKLKESIINHPSLRLLENTLSLNLIEMPCVEHAIGDDVSSFTDMINDGDALSNYDYIVITSPESAKVFANLIKNCRNTANSPLENDTLPSITAVGKATSKTLNNLGFTVAFTPSKANGETLGKELLPTNKFNLQRVLYPCSAKADNTIQEALEKRKDCSFTVTRFNTYDTVPVKFNEEERSLMMNQIDLACFGSPSSVSAWLENVDVALGISNLDEEEKKKVEGCNGNVLAVCIGGTTAKACLNSGRWKAMDIYYPKTSPGMEGWVENCFVAANDLMESRFWDNEF